MICDTPSSQDAFTDKYWSSYLREYRRYAPDSMQCLETKSEVKFKATVTHVWYATLFSPRCIHTPNLRLPPQIIYKRYALDTIILKTMSEVKVKVTVTQKWYATPRHPKMYLHTKFGIPTSKNIGDMHRTRKWDGRIDGRTEGQCDYYMPPKVPFGA